MALSIMTVRITMLKLKDIQHNNKIEPDTQHNITQRKFEHRIFLCWGSLMRSVVNAEYTKCLYAKCLFVDGDK
jgi:hypothetical protein